MFKISFFLGFLLLALPLRCSDEKQQLISDYPTAKILNVADGDSFTAMFQNKPTKFRIFGIDAPEKAMPYYKASKQKLSSLISGQTVTVEILETDRYGRNVANVILSSKRNVAHEMLRSGLVWHYKQYSNDAQMAALERSARLAKIGLWKDENPSAPWKVREIRRKTSARNQLN